MGYKRENDSISFADLAVSEILKNNRSVKMMDEINSVVNWDKVEDLLLEHY